MDGDDVSRPLESEQTVKLIRTILEKKYLDANVRYKLAVETSLWPLKEAINGEVTHTYIPKRKPIEDYLKLQGRFRHLFEPTVQGDAIAHIQKSIDPYWANVRKTERST